MSQLPSIEAFRCAAIEVEFVMKESEELVLQGKFRSLGVLIVQCTDEKYSKSGIFDLFRYL